MDTEEQKTNGQLPSVTKRLESIERRLSALEDTAPGARKLPPRKEALGIRSSRAPAIIIGIFILLFGWSYMDIGAPIIGLGLIVYGMIVGIVAKPVYRNEPAWERKAPPEQPVLQQPGVTERVGSQPVAQLSDSAELKIGRKVFAWVGITALLFGITFFVIYSFQNFGVSGKLIVGYLVAIILYGVGRWLRGSLRAFAYVLEAGGWAAAYFMTYATSFVKQVNVLDNPPVTLLFLFLIVALMAAVSLTERSKVFTAIAFLLGYGTAAISSQYENVTLWSLLFLSIGALVISWKLRWYVFGVGGAIATYNAYIVWIFRLDPQSWQELSFLTGVLFLALYGVLFGVSFLVAKPKNDSETATLQIGTLLNTLLSFGAMLYLFSVADVERWYAPLAYAVVLTVFTIAAWMIQSIPSLRTLYLILAIGALTVFIPMRFEGTTITILWVVESALLVAAGAFTALKALRVSGYVTGGLASVLVLRDIVDIASKRGDDTLRLIVVICAVLFWIAIALLLSLLREKLKKEEQLLSYAYGDVAVGFLVLLTQFKAPEKFVSVTTGLEGVLILALGLAMTSKHIRILGITALGFTAIRVFTFDIADLDALGKMISFIILGAILLSVAYIYNRARSLHPPQRNGP